MDEQAGISLWREVKQRRVLQLMGLYFGASWVALEFLGFITERYALSPYLAKFIIRDMSHTMLEPQGPQLRTPNIFEIDMIFSPIGAYSQTSIIHFQE